MVPESRRSRGWFLSTAIRWSTEPSSRCRPSRTAKATSSRRLRFTSMLSSPCRASGLRAGVVRPGGPHLPPRELAQYRRPAADAPGAEPAISADARYRPRLRHSIYEIQGVEADDVIGTLARQAREQGLHSTIVTGDLDALQLVNDDVFVCQQTRRVRDDSLHARRAGAYGLEPIQTVDLKGLSVMSRTTFRDPRHRLKKTAIRLIRSSVRSRAWSRTASG